MKTKVIAAHLAVAGVFVPACKGELQGEEPKPVVRTERANVVRRTVPVPQGFQVPCAQLLPETAPFSERMGQEIGEIKDQNAGDSSATAVCSVIRAGEPPKTPKELKTFQEKYERLGVLPGDEFCKISARCFLVSDEKTLMEQCKKRGQTDSSLDSQYACLRVTPKGPDDSYTFSFIEPDTNCVIEALAGPSVTDQELVKNCALAARDVIKKEGIANPQPFKKASPAQ